MSAGTLCKCCNLPTQARLELERKGQLAADKFISWASIQLEFAEYGISMKSLRNHCANHLQRSEAKGTSALAGIIEGAVAELLQAASVAPPDLKPLFAVAAFNLANLEKTQVSQGNLVAALKSIYEITGMKADQRIKLEMARHAFPAAKPERVEMTMTAKAIRGSIGNKAEAAESTDVSEGGTD